MKLNKRTMLFIGVAVFVAAVAALVRLSSQKLEQQNKLEKQLATTQTRLQGLQLEQLTTQKAQLEEQLKQVKPQYESAKAVISQNISSTGAASALFDAARINRLIVTELTSSSPTSVTLEGADLLSLSINAKVSGSVSDMPGFVSDLNKSFVAGAVKSVTIAVSENSTSNNVTASIELVVYSYRGN